MNGTATAANDTTTLLIVFRDTTRSDHGSRVTAIREVTKALLAERAVRGCSSSVATGLDATAGAPLAACVAMMDVTASANTIAAIVDRLEPLLDSETDSVLEVDKRQIVTGEHNWPLGSPTPGERLVSLVTRAPSFTRDAFAEYWRDVHAPVAMSFTILPSTYIQYVTHRRLFGETIEPDGVMLMHFLTADDRVNRWAEHPDEAARGAADAAVFMDLANATSTLMHETIWR